MNTYKNPKLYEARILALHRKFFSVVDGIGNSKIKDNFLIQFFGSPEEAKVIREAKEKTQMHWLIKMEKILVGPRSMNQIGKG